MLIFEIHYIHLDIYWVSRFIHREVNCYNRNAKIYHISILGSGLLSYKNDHSKQFFNAIFAKVR